MGCAQFDELPSQTLQREYPGVVKGKSHFYMVAANRTKS